MTPLRAELVIFDLDGVLIDSEVLAARAVAATLADCGFAISTAEMITRFTGVGDGVMLETLSRERGEPLPPDFIARARARMTRTFEADLEAIKGAAALLENIPTPRCVASNSPSDYIDRTLRLTRLGRFIAPEHRFSAEQVERPKPAPDIFLHAAGTMAATPSACLVVEDSRAGVAAARAAGMTVLGFVGASHLSDPQAHGRTLIAEGAETVLQELAALTEWIELA